MQGTCSQLKKGKKEKLLVKNNMANIQNDVKSKEQEVLVSLSPNSRCFGLVMAGIHNMKVSHWKYKSRRVEERILSGLSQVEIFITVTQLTKHMLRYKELPNTLSVFVILPKTDTLRFSLDSLFL